MSLSDTPPRSFRPPLRPAGEASPELRTLKARRRFASLRTIFALILREMATTYGRSPGGYLWAVLEPAAGITLLALIFSLGFRSPPLGTNFPIFYATGLVPFLMYNDISSKLATSLLFSKSLLAYPSVTFVDALVGRFVLNTITHLLVAYIIFTGILVVFDTRTLPDLLEIGIGFALAGMLALGVGTLNCFLFTMFPLWQRAWTVVTRPLLLISGVIFIYESIPSPYREWLWYNPLMHVTGQMRHAFYPGYDAAYVSYGFICGLSLVLFATGLLLLRRYHRDLLHR